LHCKELNGLTIITTNYPVVNPSTQKAKYPNPLKKEFTGTVAHQNIGSKFPTGACGKFRKITQSECVLHSMPCFNTKKNNEMRFR